MRKSKCILALIATLSLLSLTGCAYHAPVQQGTILTNNSLSSIHRGMSKYQVLSRLGKPVLINIYQDGRMVYVYTLKPNRKAMQERRLLIYFHSGKVYRYKVFSSINLKPPV